MTPITITTTTMATTTTTTTTYKSAFTPMILENKYYLFGLLKGLIFPFSTLVDEATTTSTTADAAGAFVVVVIVIP